MHKEGGTPKCRTIKVVVEFNAKTHPKLIALQEEQIIYKRIDEKDQSWSMDGIRKASANLKRSDSLLILTPPCDHGAKWFYVNRHQKTGRSRMRKKMEAYKQIWENVEILTSAANAQISIALFWPTSCWYWDKGEVTKFAQKWRLRFASYTRYIHDKDEWHKDEVTVGTNDDQVFAAIDKFHNVTSVKRECFLK